MVLLARPVYSTLGLCRVEAFSLLCVDKSLLQLIVGSASALLQAHDTISPNHSSQSHSEQSQHSPAVLMSRPCVIRVLRLQSFGLYPVPCYMQGEGRVGCLVPAVSTVCAGSGAGHRTNWF